MATQQNRLVEHIDHATRRLVEVELHHTDLGAGYGPAEWLPEFAAMELPEPMRSQREDRRAWMLDA